MFLYCLVHNIISKRCIKTRGSNILERNACIYVHIIKKDIERTFYRHIQLQINFSSEKSGKDFLNDVKNFDLSLPFKFLS